MFMLTQYQKENEEKMELETPMLRWFGIGVDTTIHESKKEEGTKETIQLPPEQFVHRG
jgi:hypothetical protein